MTEADNIRMLGNLVRVECDDGHIVWTLPENVEATRTCRIRPATAEEIAAEVSYWKTIGRHKEGS